SWRWCCCCINSNLHATLKSGFKFNCFEVLVLSFAHPDKKAISFTLVIVYRPPGPYSGFLLEFADFLSSLVVNSDKVAIVTFCYFKIRLLQCSFVWMCKFLSEKASANS
ncbi:hypothetical protein SKAU_G00059680, partial [Synaphobranchus kaupii]